MAFLPPAVVPVKIETKKISPLLDVKIASPNGYGAGTSIEINGEKVINAHAVKFEITADNWAVTEIKFLANTFSYEGKASVSVDAKTAELLVKLGWTPPA